MSVLDLIMGYTDPRVKYMYNTTDFFGGQEVLLNDNVNPVF